MARRPSSEAGTGVNQVKAGGKEVSGRGTTWAKVLSWEEAVSGQHHCSFEEEVRKREMRWAVEKDLVFMLRLLGKVLNKGGTGLDSTSGF